MSTDIARVAALIGDPARANMLVALMGGKALTASELALEADITSQTASSHLSKLLKNDLLVVQKQGRHKYFQLAGEEVAALLESLLNISSKVEHSQVITGPRNPELRKTRVCYDHMAGELGVSLFDALLKQNFLIDDHGSIAVTERGTTHFDKLGASISELKKLKRPLCKSCLDWSERRHHLAGSLGKWILQDAFRKGWAKKDLDSRVIRFSPEGLQRFNKRYGISPAT